MKDTFPPTWIRPGDDGYEPEKEPGVDSLELVTDIYGLIPELQDGKLIYVDRDSENVTYIEGEDIGYFPGWKK